MFIYYDKVEKNINKNKKLKVFFQNNSFIFSFSFFTF